jgi:hypothetical protein
MSTYYKKRLWLLLERNTPSMKLGRTSKNSQQKKKLNST